MNGRAPRYDFALLAPLSRKWQAAAFEHELAHALQRCDALLLVSAKFGLTKWQRGDEGHDLDLQRLTPQMRVRMIFRMGEQAEALIWEQLPDGYLPRILSYLPEAYYEAFREADDLLAHITRSPYSRLGPFARLELLIAETATYGLQEQRR